MIPSPDIFGCLTSDTRNYSLITCQPLGKHLLIEAILTGETGKSSEVAQFINSNRVNKILASSESQSLYQSIRKIITHRVALLNVTTPPEPISSAQILQMAYKDFTLTFPDRATEEQYIKVTTRKYDPKDLPITLKGLFILVPYILQHPGNNYAQISPPGVIL